jgi:hypothetical protein
MCQRRVSRSEVQGGDADRRESRDIRPAKLRGRWLANHLDEGLDRRIVQAGQSSRGVVNDGDLEALE